MRQRMEWIIEMNQQDATCYFPIDGKTEVY